MTFDISVIIPVYNDQDRVGHVLERLMRQTYPKDRYEVIIVDNGSTDGSPGIVSDFANSTEGHIQLLFQTGVQGSYASRNQGIRGARGKLLAFTDADCIPAADWLEQGLAALYREKARCGGGHIQLFARGEKPNVYEHFDTTRKMNQRDYIKNAGFAATANFFAELFSLYGEFRNDLISGGDYEFGRRLTNGGENLIYIPDAVIYHPARTTFKEIWKKSKRVAEGQKELAALNLLAHGRLSWQRALPTLAGARERNLSLVQRLHYICLANVIRYTNLWVRLHRT